MGDFKGLADKLKSKENKYVMDAGKVKIGKGVLSYDETILIPLDAVSFVEISEQEQSGQDAYALKIQNHAGMCFYITAPDIGALREIRSALMICINDRSAVYSGIERAVSVGGDIFRGDNILSAADIRINSSRHQKEREVVSGKKKSVRAEVITILDDEWKTLEEYAQKRMEDFGENERNHTICKALATAAELKNKEKCKMILDVSGNDALDMIIVGAPISIKAIVNKIM